MDIMYILQTMEKTILEQHTGTRTDREFQGIILLKNQAKLLEDFLYVGNYSDGVRLLKNCPADRSITMFLAAEDVNQTRLSDCHNHNIVVSALDLFELYNRINIILCNYRHWSTTLREALCDGLTLPQLLNTAAEMIHSQIYFLNSGFKLIVGSHGHYFDEPLGADWLPKEASPLNTPNRFRMHSRHTLRKTAAASTCKRICSILPAASVPTTATPLPPFWPSIRRWSRSTLNIFWPTSATWWRTHSARIWNFS